MYDRASRCGPGSSSDRGGKLTCRARGTMLQFLAGCIDVRTNRECLRNQFIADIIAYLKLPQSRVHSEAASKHGPRGFRDFAA